MEEDLEKYLKKHIMLLMMVVVTGFLLLAAGEYYLLRQIRYVNRMVSEGMMQIKEIRTKDLMLKYK